MTQFKVDVPATAMFDYPTINALAAFILQGWHSNAGSHALQQPSAPHHDTLALQGLQHRLAAPRHRPAASDVVGWAASAASDGNALSSECVLATQLLQCNLNVVVVLACPPVRLRVQLVVVLPVCPQIGSCLCTRFIPPHFIAAAATRAYTGAECITPVPLERWDLECAPQIDDTLQVALHAYMPTCLAARPPVALLHCMLVVHSRPIMPCFFMLTLFKLVNVSVQASTLRFAAWMDGVALFDEALFRLSRMEAVGLDPQCRKLLENTFAAMQVQRVPMR